MSPSVVSYDTIAVIEEEHHLGVPIIGRQRPAVAKDDGLTFAPVLVVNLRSVFVVIVGINALLVYLQPVPLWSQE